jgi:hypothetical protein
VGVLGLALNASDERNGYPLKDLGRIKELLVRVRDLRRVVPEIEDEADKMRAARQTFRLIHLADIVAVTSGASGPGAQPTRRVSSASTAGLARDRSRRGTCACRSRRVRGLEVTNLTADFGSWR